MSNDQNEFIHLDCPRCGALLQMEGDMLTCQYCGAKLILKHGAARQETRPENAGGSRTTVNGIALKPFAYHDPQAGLEAFSILVPDGWKMDGGVTWIITRPAVPAAIGFEMSNPAGLEAFTAFPSIYFTWTNNPMMQLTKPTGSQHFGYEVRQPVPASVCMRQYVLPRARKIPDLTIVDEGPAVELLQAVTHNQADTPPGGQYSTDSVRVRLHYIFNQQPAAEEMSGVTEYTRITAPGMLGNVETVFWSMSYMTGFRAAREKIENYADLYRAIFTSIKINPAWTALVQQVSQGLVNNTIRSIHHVGELSRQISRNYQEMSDSNMQGWQERSAAYDRVAENFSQTIRGVDPYFDPNTGQNVELPGGYTQAWSTPLGEYILSDDPNFNPNIGSTQTWTQLGEGKK